MRCSATYRLTWMCATPLQTPASSPFYDHKDVQNRRSSCTEPCITSNYSTPMSLPFLYLGNVENCGSPCTEFRLTFNYNTTWRMSLFITKRMLEIMDQPVLSLASNYSTHTSPPFHSLWQCSESWVILC